MRVSVWVAVVCPGTNRVLLAKRGPTTRNAGRWNFFGGGIDDGEHPEETALRELAEEAGVSAARDDLIYLGHCRTGTKRNLLFVVTTQVEFDPAINHESQDWCWMALSDLLALRRLHGPTEKLSPLLRQWLEILPTAAPAPPPPPAPIPVPVPVPVPPPTPAPAPVPSQSRWEWLLSQVSRCWG